MKNMKLIMENFRKTMKEAWPGTEEPKASWSGKPNHDWSADIGYTAAGLSINYHTGKDEKWEANASYDLGGGATFKAAVNEAEYMAAGMQFSF